MKHQCPKCQSANTVKNGTKGGKQRIKCADCGKFSAIGADGDGRFKAGDKPPMTSAERVRRFRAKKSQPPLDR